MNLRIDERLSDDLQQRLRAQGAVLIAYADLPATGGRA